MFTKTCNKPFYFTLFFCLINKGTIQMEVTTLMIIVYFIILVPLIIGFIYVVRDYNKYKEQIKKENAETIAQIVSESTDRRTNVGFIVDETNRVNQGMYKELKNDIISTKEDVEYSMDKYGRVMKLIQPNGAPEWAPPEVSFNTKVNMASAKVSGATEVNNLIMGDKFTLGVDKGDWLRLYDKNGSSYFGGLAVNKMMVQGDATMKGPVALKGGASEFNPDGWATLLPHTDGRNYIRGETDVTGNLDIKGDTSVGRNFHVKGDQIFNGGNNWIIHTPDDQRRTMLIAPSGTYGGLNWDWPNSLELRAAEKQIRVNNGSICINNTCINEAQLAAIKTKTGV